MSVTIKLNLKQFSHELVEGVVLRTATKAERAAKRFVAKDTGNLMNSITKQVSEKEAVVYSDVEYAIEQEYGNETGKKFTPYMRPAAQFAGRQSEIDKAVIAEAKRLSQ